MKSTLWPVLSVLLALLLVGCATADGDYDHGSPPPGSHSPFADGDPSDPTDSRRDESAPDEQLPEDEEPEEPVEPER